MAGYHNFSKSNNAIDAENRGLMTASDAAKWLAAHGRRYKGIAAADIKNCAHYSEWHHTSSWYNETQYYAATDIFSARRDLAEKAAARRDAGVKTYTGVTVKYLEWSGSRRRPKATEVTLENCTVTDKGGAMVTIEAQGQKPFRKSKTARGLEFNGYYYSLFEDDATPSEVIS